MTRNIFQSRRRHRSRRLFLGLVVIPVAAIVVGTGAWLARAESGRLPPETVIGGVDVGGMPVEEARALLEARAEAVVRRPITLEYESGELRTSGKALGATADVDEALERALTSRDRLSRVWARLGLADTIELPLTFRVNEQRVAKVARRVERRVERAPEPARLELVGTEVVTLPSQTGIELDQAALGRQLRLLPTRVQLEVEEVAPSVSDEAAERARLQADAVLRLAPTVVFRERQLELTRELLAGALRFRASGDAIGVTLDPAVLEKPLARAFRQFEREPREATFRIEGERAILVPARRGRKIAVKRTSAAILAGAGLSEVQALFDVVVPELTTREAKQLRIRELVSEFTTPYSCCQPRVSNIQRAAQILDGEIIKAGTRFSLNARLGERTNERGFLPAPQIYDGRLEDAVGGGVSQVATTFYNTAFFAGLELIEHTPHQFYISRYPMGREATVSWGGPELVFRNDWPAAILVKVDATDTSITVRFYSTMLGRRVETETGEPYDFVEPTVIREANTELPPGQQVVIQDGGVRGFSVDYTRKVYRGKRLLRDEHFHVQYDPENTIIEYGPTESADAGGSADAAGSADAGA